MNEFADFGWAVQQMSPSEERAALARSITKMQIRTLDTRTLLHLVTSPMCDNPGSGRVNRISKFVRVFGRSAEEERDLEPDQLP